MGIPFFGSHCIDVRHIIAPSPASLPPPALFSFKEWPLLSVSGPPTPWFSAGVLHRALTVLNASKVYAGYEMQHPKSSFKIIPSKVTDVGFECQFAPTGLSSYLYIKNGIKLQVMLSKIRNKYKLTTDI